LRLALRGWLFFNGTLRFILNSEHERRSAPNMYVFFERDTGKVLLTHQEVSPSGEALQVTREELMDVANRAAPLLDQREGLDNLDVIEVDQKSYLLRRVLSPEDGKEVYVDVQNRVLSERER